jgi:hypothetical protein
MGIVMIFVVIGAQFDRRLILVSLRLAGALLLVIVAVGLTSVFREGVAVFSARWDEGLGANGSFNDAIVQRFFGDFISAFSTIPDVPLLGKGIGLGSNVAAKLLTGDLDFLLAESEWPRTIQEMGPLVGLTWLLFRCGLLAVVLFRTGGALRRGRALGWLLLSTCALDLVYAPMEQSMMLGFLSFGGGLSLAAINPSRLLSRQRNLEPYG